MGSFMGHILPGMIFLLFGVWLCFKYPYKYFVQKRKGVKKFTCMCTLDTFEGVAKIVFPLIGIFAEQYTDNGPAFHLTDPNGDYWDGNIWSHCTMYTFFIFSGITDLLLHRFPKWTPRGAQYFTLGLACFIEGFLFYFHTHGRPDVDVRIHVLLIFAIWGGAGTMLLLCFIDALISKGSAKGKSNDAGEATSNGGEYVKLLNCDSQTTSLSSINDDDEIYINKQHSSNGTMNQCSHELQLLESIIEKGIKSNKPSLNCSQIEILLQLVFTTTILVQGSWFCQIAAMLYPPGGKPWDVTLHENTTFATIFFTWHLAIMIVFVATAYFLVGFVTSKKR